MFDKLSSYNLVTNLVPGAILAVALSSVGVPIVEPENIGAFLIAAYALGSLTNRIGSIFLDPVLIRLKFLSNRNYVAYVEACEKDTKIETLVENAKAFRTFATGGFLFFAIIFAYKLALIAGISQKIMFYGSVLLFTLIFAFSYRRQNGYIVARVNRFLVADHV